MFQTINREQFLELRNANDKTVRVVDVLDESHYQQEHIKGAISLPLGKIDKYALKRLDQNDKVIVYCASTECQASTAAAEKFVALGFKNVYDYKEGLKGYKEANLPLEGSLHEKAGTSCGTSSCSVCGSSC